MCIRCPLTNGELGKLIVVAKDHGREVWYLAAELAGLGIGDL